MTREIKCIEVERRLIEYAEGILTAEEQRAFQSHLESCPACAALAEEARMLLSSDIIEGNERAPDSLWRSIQNEINRLDKGRLKQPTLLSTRRPFVTFSLRTLGAAAALLLGIYLGGGTVQNAESAELTYEDELVEYYASAFQAESAIPVGEVISELNGASEGGQ